MAATVSPSLVSPYTQQHWQTPYATKSGGKGSKAYKGKGKGKGNSKGKGKSLPYTGYTYALVPHDETLPHWICVYCQAGHNNMDCWTCRNFTCKAPRPEDPLPQHNPMTTTTTKNGDGKGKGTNPKPPAKLSNGMTLLRNYSSNTAWSG